MAWGKVDDKLHSSPKWRAASKGARALWVTAMSWSMDQLTDGAIPAHMMGSLDGTRGEAASLVAVGLWETAEGGWQFHDWADYQPSRVQVLAEREAAKSRQRRAREKAKSGRESHRDESVTHAPVTPTVTGPPTRPVPLVPEPNGSGAAEPTAPPSPETAQTLIAEWIEHCGDRPPGRVVGQVSKELGAMLAEGIGVEDVRRGLAAWHRKGLHPSALASVVHETRTGPRRSTTDDKVRTGLDLAAEIRAESSTALIGA